ncbi:MAG: alpha/beta hydrolase domain-containing protein [Candidatus Promineifilaceae bacterium]|nr:alpha/beta hydrolase domain-containing protein [Candidatus Promineifilaceae bacterium]
MRFRSSFWLLAFPLLLFLLLAAASGAPPTRAASLSSASLDVSFVENASQPFGTFDGVAFVRHTGLFEGETSLGPFRVPYEIVAPADPALGNGSVLVEPPHFLFGTIGRDFSLGRSFVFQTVSGYAAVGFGENGLNILDPSASGLMLAGEPVSNPGLPNPTGIVDEEILIQFTRALSATPYAADVLGNVDRRYAYGISQTSAVLLNMLLSPAAEGLYDFTLLNLRFWPEPEELGADTFTRLQGDFTPPTGVGRVIFVQSESELVRSDAEQFRVAVGEPGYRLYEVAGAPHFPQPTPLNPLATWPVVRAAFTAADEWVRAGVAPPSSSVLESAPAGQIDPVYGSETGIARDANLNALGGIRFPDLAIGRAQFVAAAFSLDPNSPFPGTFGLWFDLACEPEPGSDSDEPRFSNHGEYVNAFTQQVNALQGQGFLLDSDAEALKDRAAESAVGKPGTCSG